MIKSEKWLEWAIELQSIAQIGLTYCKDDFDEERYKRIREISADIICHKGEISLDKVENLFCNETGYQTPKLDTRAAIFLDGKILLVKEKEGAWTLPGGWCDVNLSAKENIMKEVKEETGLDVVVDLIIAVQDRAKHNLPIYAYGICKIFFMCTVIGGSFQKNLETIETKYFTLNELPCLAIEKTNKEQIEMCFKAYSSNHWVTQFD